MMTSKFFGGVRGFAIAGNSMRTRIFLFLFFASTSGLWAQEVRQVREVREERGEEARAQEANPAQGDIDRGAGAPAVRGNNGRVVNRRIRVGEKKDNDKPIRGESRPEKVERAISGNGTGGTGGGGGGGGGNGLSADQLELHGDNLPRPQMFVRGDVNGDGQISTADAIAILNWLTDPMHPNHFHPPAWTSGFSCFDAADANDDGFLASDDAMKILIYVFMNRPLPAPSASAPNYIASDCGEDLTEDDLGCDVESAVCN